MSSNAYKSALAALDYCLANRRREWNSTDTRLVTEARDDLAAELAAAPQPQDGKATYCADCDEWESGPCKEIPGCTHGIPSGQTLAGAGEGVSLPELPEPAGHSGIPAFSEFYTADQMREYARRAREVG